MLLKIVIGLVCWMLGFIAGRYQPRDRLKEAFNNKYAHLDYLVKPWAPRENEGE